MRSEGAFGRPRLGLVLGVSGRGVARSGEAGVVLAHWVPDLPLEWNLITETSAPESGMDLRDLLSDEEFLSRSGKSRRPEHTAEALQSMARAFAEPPPVVLQRLVDVAVEYCGADSAGISLEEADGDGELHFRWVAISGSFAQYVNGTTPRFFSPCGTCLNSGKPQLYTVSKPYYDFLGVTADPITDGMLVPWEGEGIRGTIWAVAHSSNRAFDVEDYKLLRTLADFALIVIRHEVHEKAARELESAKAAAAMANKLAHEINNPLQCLANCLYLASLGGADAPGHIDRAIEDLSALSALVGRLLTIVRSADSITKS